MHQSPPTACSLCINRPTQDSRLTLFLFPRQFCKDLLLKDQIREIHWHRRGHDRYVVVYNDERVAYVQVPQDDWVSSDLINKQPGLRVHEITEEGERDASTGTELSH